MYVSIYFFIKGCSIIVPQGGVGGRGGGGGGFLRGVGCNKKKSGGWGAKKGATTTGMENIKCRANL